MKETLEEHSAYNVMVIGYSLGAGICQLAVMDMLAGEHKDSVPDGTEIRCVNFGSPPVFKSDAADENADSDNCDNIFREGGVEQFGLFEITVIYIYSTGCPK